MPSFIYEGKRYVLTKAAYQCVLCGTGFETKKNHGFYDCECGAVRLHGGIRVGAIMSGHPKHCRDVSTWRTEGPRPRERLPQEVLDKLHAEFVASFEKPAESTSNDDGTQAKSKEGAQ